MFESVEELLARARRPREQDGRPWRARQRRPSAKSWTPIRPAHPDRRDLPALAEARRRSRGRPRARRRRPVFPGRDARAGAPARRSRRRAAHAADAARPQRRQGRHRRGQGGRGRRGVGAVRRRPAAHVPALRRAAGLEDRDARRQRVRPRRLQGRHARGAGRHRRGRLEPAEVRGRRAPRAAGARHRVAGPHPHQRRPASWCCPRPRRSTSRSTRTTCASTSTARRPGRPERQHHRLRGADHPCAHRHGRVVPEREEPAAEQGVGDADPAGAPAGAAQEEAAAAASAERAARSARSTAPSGSAPTTSRRTGSPTTG